MPENRVKKLFLLVQFMQEANKEEYIVQANYHQK